VAPAALRFDTASRGLDAAGGADQVRVDAVAAEHDALLASLERLDEVAASGGDVLEVYASTHDRIEGELGTQLAALEAAISTQLELALLESAAAHDRLASLFPIILLATVAALYTLWRLRLAGRRADSLQRLIEEKDVFIGTVSHELRTPLTGILGLSSELVDHGESITPAMRGQYHEVVLAQALEMRDLIEDLLVAARSNIGKVGIRLTDLDLSQLVHKVLAESALMQSAEAPAVVVGEGTALVRADRMRFRQILRNLLTNASRYGGDAVTITFGAQDGMGRVSVCDNGDGVPPGSERLIFLPYRSAAGADRPSASVGLGLSVSRTLARLMGGDLAYRREAGQTVFELSLPLCDVAPRTEEPAVPIGSTVG
jgi:signal transduction histidine kinase